MNYGRKPALISPKQKRSDSEATPCIVGEDPSSSEAHIQVLHMEYQKMQPDAAVVRDRMQQTFPWRQREIADGMTVEATLTKYPFLRTPLGLCDELERIHPATGNVYQRFRDGFTPIVPKVLVLAREKCPYFQFLLEAKEDALAEDLPEIDVRAALLFLPYIFRENIDLFVTLGERDPDSPYPTLQLQENQWKSAFTSTAPILLKVDGTAVCRCTKMEDGVIAAFCSYFVFNIAYPKHLRNTLMFLQRYITKLHLDGDLPLSTTVLRKVNILY